MPKDTNPKRRYFWRLADVANGFGQRHSGLQDGAHSRVTVAVDGMSFLEPVRVGDTVACYAWVESIGRTSMKIPVEAWVERFMHTKQTRVTRAVFTCVAVNPAGRPIPVQRD